MNLTKEEFEKTGIELTKYERENLQAWENLLAEIKPYIPDVQLMYIVDEYEGKYYYRCMVISFVREGLPYCIYKRDKRYSIYADMQDLKNVASYDRNRVEDQIGHPNKIGILSQKKVDAWIQFYAKVYAELKAMDEKNGNIKAAFLESIKGEPVQWRDGGRKGYIIRNGIKFQFTIDENCISTEIGTTEHYGVNIETFRQLADNKYVQSTK